MQPVIWGAVKIYAHKIPERMGWKFYCIWSTDWFRNKSAECEQKELGDAKEARGTTFFSLIIHIILSIIRIYAARFFAFMAYMIPSMAIPASFLYLKK